MVAGLEADTPEDFLAMAKHVCLSPLGRDGEHAASTDYHRQYSDGTLDMETMFASDACGAHNGFIRVSHAGKVVLEKRLGSDTVYVPGPWQQSLAQMYARLADERR